MKRWLAGLLGVSMIFLVAACAAAPRSGKAVPDLEYGGVPSSGMAPVDNAPGQQAEGGAAPSALPTNDMRMVIYNGELELVVPDTLEAQKIIGAWLDQAGGYVESSSSYNYGENRITVDLVLRVPADQFNATMDTLRGLATEVRRDSVRSQDVGQEYVDLRSRLRALELRAQKLEEFLNKAEDTDAVLRVYNELSATQVEIEQVKGRMQYLERMVAMATITVKLIPDELAQPVEIPGWHPDAIAKKAIELLVRTLQGLATVFIWLALYLLPVALILGVLLYGFIRLLMAFYRRLRRRRA